LGKKFILIVCYVAALSAATLGQSNMAVGGVQGTPFLGDEYITVPGVKPIPCDAMVHPWRYGNIVIPISVLAKFC
jgi:hypothetical protein